MEQSEGCPCLLLCQRIWVGPPLPFVSMPKIYDMSHHIVETLARVRGGKFTTRKPIEFPGLGPIQPTQGAAIRIWREKERDMQIRGIVHCKVGKERGSVLVHFRQAERTIEDLFNMAQGDRLLNGLSLSHYCVHGDLRPSVEHSNCTFEVSERTALMPIVQMVHPTVDNSHRIQIRTSTGLIPASTLAEQSLIVFYMGRKIDTLSLGSKKSISFLGATFDNENDFLFGTLNDLTQDALYRPSSSMMALPKLTAQNALPVFRALYYFYESHCRIHGKPIDIEFPEKAHTGIWGNYMPQVEVAVEML